VPAGLMPAPSAADTGGEISGLSRELVSCPAPGVRPALTLPSPTSSRERLMGAPQVVQDAPSLRGEALLEQVLKARTLPSPPAVALRLLRMAPDPEVGDAALARVLEMDPALSARVLRMANSAFFALPSEVRTLDQALPVLGRGAVTSLALSFSLTDDSMRTGPLAGHFRRFWLRCAVQASAAETLARFRVQHPAPELFITGLLLDLGQLALLKALGDRYARILGEVRGISAAGGASPGKEEGDFLTSLEKEQLGVTHAEVGARILEAWGIPDSIHTVVREHHDPPIHLASRGRHATVLSAMRVASCVADCFLRVAPTESLTSLSAHLQDHLNLPDQEVIRFLLEADARVQEAATVLSAETDGRMTAEELMAEAADHWSMLALERDLAARRAMAGEGDGGGTVEVSVLRRENEQLRRQVFLDPLTRLYNRRYIDEMLHTEARRAAENAEPVGFLFMDIDHFKWVNDSLGHAVGDEVLVGVARRIQGMLRSRDLLARYGGEEFVVLVRGTPLRGMVALADRLRGAVEEEPFEVDGASLRVTVSLGGALTQGDAGILPDLEALLILADQAMYASKHRGRNRVTIRGHDGTLVTGPNELLEAAQAVADGRGESGPGVVHLAGSPPPPTVHSYRAAPPRGEMEASSPGPVALEESPALAARIRGWLGRR
jgi:diguanylate cyclase (GGDEF)-like protein